LCTAYDEAVETAREDFEWVHARRQREKEWHKWRRMQEGLALFTFFCIQNNFVVNNFVATICSQNNDSQYVPCNLSDTRE
jgi:hypothetical protein